MTRIRKLLIVGAMSRIRWIVRKGALPDNWLGRIVGRKPRAAESAGPGISGVSRLAENAAVEGP